MNEETTKDAAQEGVQQPENGASTASENESRTGNNAPQLTAENVSEMIQAALKDFGQQQEAAKSEAEKLAGMNEQQRAEYQRDSYRDELEKLRAQLALGEMQKTARSILAQQNIHLPDALLVTLVAADAETTKTNVDAFVALYTQAVEDGVKARLKGAPPKTGKTTGARMTKEQIFAIKNDDERLKAIQTNMDLFD
ncbi:MAG: DUF4355 domain-containing protein [Ruminococcus sp.]|nr:DUF4355 domain-containing protein [Ruminococcus sp.]